MKTIRVRPVVVKPISMLACMLTIALAAAACSSSKTSDDSGAAAVGVSEDEIHLGILTDITGPFKALSEQQNLGVQLYWDNKNANGGTCERKVVIDTRDHGYDPQKAVSLATELNDKVLAYQITTGSPTTMAIRPELEDNDIMAIAMSWSPELGESPSIVIPGTYYSAEMVAALDYLVDEGTLAEGDTVGHVYFAGDFGEPALDGLQYAADRHGITVKAVQIDPTVTDLTSQVNQLADAGVSAIFMNASPAQLASVAGLTEAQGLDVPIVTSAPGYSPQLLDTNIAAPLEQRGLVVGSTTAYSADVPGVEAVRKLYGEANTKIPPSQWVVTGYAAAAIMDDAISAACENGDLNRESLAAVFEDGLSVDTDGATVALDLGQAGSSPSDLINILKPAKSAEGGLEVVETDYLGPDVENYLAQ